MSRHSTLSYSSVGVNRRKREVSRSEIARSLRKDSNRYPWGEPIELPFETIYPLGQGSDSYLDFQIEGVGTKTLLAELCPGGYSTIGIDAVAMAVNDVIRSGARPMLLSDAIHIAKSRGKIVQDIVSGVRRGAEASGAFLASGETGDVPDVLHSRLDRATKNASEPFDLFVSCVGLVQKPSMISGIVSVGDEILGIKSNGIHSNGLTLARRILLKDWGGMYRLDDRPAGIDLPLIEELLRPTEIYSRAVQELNRGFKIKAAVHITGDGFAKFARLGAFQRNNKKVGFEFEPLGGLRGIFHLIYEAAKKQGTRVTLKEMFRTFNMGYGFAVVLERGDVNGALDLLNKYHRAERIGRVTESGLVTVSATEMDGNRKSKLVL